MRCMDKRNQVFDATLQKQISCFTAKAILRCACRTWAHVTMVIVGYDGFYYATRTMTIAILMIMSILIFLSLVVIIFSTFMIMLSAPFYLCVPESAVSLPIVFQFF